MGGFCAVLNLWSEEASRAVGDVDALSEVVRQHGVAEVVQVDAVGAEVFQIKWIAEPGFNRGADARIHQAVPAAGVEADPEVVIGVGAGLGRIGLNGGNGDPPGPDGFAAAT